MNGGAFGEGFPYSNFHDLNMDWIIKIAKDFLDQYTNIQQTITEGLEGLDSKAQELEDLLQQWYYTHSEDIANQLADALTDLNNWYNTHEDYLNQTLAENIRNFNASADYKTAESLASIPSDYTALSDISNYFKNRFNTNTSFYEPDSSADVMNFTDCGTVAKKIPIHSYIDMVSFKCGVPHAPMVAIINANTREILYKEIKSETYSAGSIAVFDIGKSFSVETYVVISKSAYKFENIENSVSFKPISYDTLYSAQVGSTINYNEELDNPISYFCTINIIEPAYINETQKQLSLFYSNGGTVNNFDDYCALDDIIPPGTAIDSVTYKIGMNNYYPRIAFLNANTNELLYKEQYPTYMPVGSEAIFQLNAKVFDVPTRLAVYAPQYLFVDSSYSEYDKTIFHSLTKSLIINGNIGDIISFHDDPFHYVTYNINLKSVLTYSDDTSASMKALTQNVIIVAKNNGDFTKVSDAVANAKDGDIILIYPGVYDNETIEAWGKKLYIIGYDKELVIIKNNTNTYYTPALEMAKGLLKGVTILQDQDLSEPTTSDYPYCIHIDHNDLTNETFIIEDCIFDAKYNASLGIGLRNNGKLIIRNCIMKTEHTLNGANAHIGALFVHPGETGMNQYIEVDNCQMISKYGSAMHFENVYQANARATATITKCLIWSEETGATNAFTQSGTPQNVFVSGKSFGNNIALN